MSKLNGEQTTALDIFGMGLLLYKILAKNFNCELFGNTDESLWVTFKRILTMEKFEKIGDLISNILQLRLLLRIWLNTSHLTDGLFRNVWDILFSGKQQRRSSWFKWSIILCIHSITRKVGTFVLGFRMKYAFHDWPIHHSEMCFLCWTITSNLFKDFFAEYVICIMLLTMINWKRRLAVLMITQLCTMSTKNAQIYSSKLPIVSVAMKEEIFGE